MSGPPDMLWSEFLNIVPFMDEPNKHIMTNECIEFLNKLTESQLGALQTHPYLEDRSDEHRRAVDMRIRNDAEEEGLVHTTYDIIDDIADGHIISHTVDPHPRAHEQDGGGAQQDRAKLNDKLKKLLKEKGYRDAIAELEMVSPNNKRDRLGWDKFFDEIRANILGKIPDGDDDVEAIIKSIEDKTRDYKAIWERGGAFCQARVHFPSKSHRININPGLILLIQANFVGFTMF